MRTIVAAAVTAGLVAGVAWAVDTSQESRPALSYPQARRGDTIDTYHGVEVADPFRWLEDPDSPETRAWIEAENAVTEQYLADIPARQPIRERLTKLWNFERYGVPTHRSGTYVYTRNDGLQNQSVLYVTHSLEDEPRVLLDPNTLSADGTVALTGYELSDDGRRLAYGLANAGSDWETWHVRTVADGVDTDDVIRWVKFSAASWSSDSQGFYYSRYDEPTDATALTGVNYYQKLYYHRLGTPQADDRLVYERKDQKEWGFYGEVTDDGQYLIITVGLGTERKKQIFYLDLKTPGAEVVELIRGFDADYSFVGNQGTTFWLHTDKDAPRYRLVAVDIQDSEPGQWREVIPSSRDVLEGVSLVGDQFIASYLADAHSEIRLFDLDGKAGGSIELPALGTVGGFGGRRGDTETFYSFTGFTTAPTIYRFDLATRTSHVFREPKVDFDADRYETRQVFYASRDGTPVPMFLVHRKDLKLDGSHPTYLYGYGGFNISLTPTFSIGRIVWLELGGVFAMPNLRGGGEYGAAWHDAGRKAKKQNVFDDFIAAAEYLVRQRYTSREKLAISGRSNGGLLVGACLTQRPELFGAALPGVGVMDMLRFHKFTIGWAWASEYGSSDDAEQFRTLYAYSPLHNIRPGTTYPATLVITADHDDRVVPGHSFKFAAALQAAQAGDAPILIRIETSAGHGAGTPTTKLIDESADSFAFLVKALGMKMPAAFAEKH